MICYSSTPAYQSPIRHHRRGASEHREVKETLNARSEYTNNETDGKAEHHLNQYLIKEEIGRGSFGAVHFATDQYGREFVSNFLISQGFKKSSCIADIGSRRLKSSRSLDYGSGHSRIFCEDLVVGPCHDGRGI